MSRRRSTSIAVLAVLLCSVSLAADTGSGVALRSGVVAPLADGEAGDAAAAGATRWVVRFHSPTGSHERLLLARSGARVEAPLPGRAYLVTTGPGAGAALAHLPGVDWATRYRAEHKLAPEIASVRSAEDAADDVIVLLHLFRDAETGAVAAGLEAAGLRVVGSGDGARFHRIVLLMNPAEVEAWRDAFAGRDDVFWVGRRYRRTLLNDTSIWVGQSGLGGGQTTPLFDRGLYGEGQVAAVLDTGIDADSCQFRDGTLGLPPTNVNGGTTIDPAQRKVLAVDFLWSAEDPADPTDWDTQNHGTHVAGTLAGDDLATPLEHDPNDGMAPGAKLVIQDGGYQVDNCGDLPGIGCPVIDLVPLFQQTYDQGARFHSNSWGDNENAPVQNNYTDASEDVDEFMWSHPDFLVVFAAGNSGPGDASVGSPSTNKNGLSVGATLRGTSAESLASFSSRGPTDDDRIKPDITFPGSGIVSARNDFNVNSDNCGSRSMSGTSMACPGAAGLAVLVRAYFADGFYPSGEKEPADAFDATAALVKATVVNSAVSMANADPIPSNDQGWGRVLLDSALHFAGDARGLYVDDHADGFVGPADPPVEYAVEVLDPAEPLKVTLAWTDFPSTPAASVHLLNDLDLVVEGPAGTFLGNVFAAGQSVPGGAADRLNNLEQVLVNVPAAGSYTVRVSAFAVPAGPQTYGLAITGAVEVSTGPRPRYRSHVVDDAPPGGNGDGVLDPGETATVPITLRNGGGELASAVEADLLSGEPQRLKVYRRTASYPDLAPGAEGTSAAPHYEITIEPDAPCGDALPARLAIRGDDFEVESGLDLEAGRTTGDWPSTDTPLGIPKKSTAGEVSTLAVSETFTLDEVDVTVNLTHGDIGELQVVLTSPTGTAVTLHDRSGPGTADLHATYDDATTPDGPGTMQDFAGEPSNGAWTLRVLDLKAGPVRPGTLDDWTLRLRADTPFQCTPLSCAEPAPGAVGSTLLLQKGVADDLLLAWDGVPGAVDYNVWRDTGPGFTEGGAFAGASGGSATFTDTGALALGESHYYLVRATNSCRWEGP